MAGDILPARRVESSGHLRHRHRHDGRSGKGSGDRAARACLCACPAHIGAIRACGTGYGNSPRRIVSGGNGQTVGHDLGRAAGFAHVRECFTLLGHIRRLGWRA